MSKLFFVALVAAQAAAAQGLNAQEREALLGKSLADGVRRHARLLDSANAQSFVDHVGARITAHLPAGAPAFTFTLTDGDPYRDPTVGLSPTQEPTSLPGGYLFVPAGLFLAAESEVEFAGMLAHAMVHVADHHYARLPGRGRQGVDGYTPAGFVGQSFHGVLPLGLRKQFRSHENRADLIAVQLMSEAGYDPAAFRNYIGRMPDVRNLNVSAWPPRGERVAAIEEGIEQLPARTYEEGGGEFRALQEEVRALIGVPR